MAIRNQYKYSKYYDMYGINDPIQVGIQFIIKGHKLFIQI